MSQSQIDKMNWIARIWTDKGSLQLYVAAQLKEYICAYIFFIQ